MNPPFGAKDGAILARLFKSMNSETIPLIHQFFSSQDEFILKAGHSTQVFAGCIEKLIKELKEGNEPHAKCRF
jgi:hypothetical protein